MLELHVYEFKNDETYVAFGELDDMMMAVYEKRSYGLKKTTMSFPACLRFMPYAEGKALKTMTRKQFLLKYRGMLKPEDIGPAEI